MKTSNNEMLDSMVMTDEGMTVDMEKLKQAQQTLKASGDKMGGKLGEAVKIAAELQVGINEAGGKCLEAAAEIAPYFDMKSLSATRDYPTGTEKFKNLISVNETTLAIVEAFKPELAKRLDGIGFTGKDREDFDRGFEKKWGKTAELVHVIRKIDIELGKIGIAMMEELGKADSQWKWDDKADQPSFKTDAQAEQFNSHMERLEELGKKQGEAQEELVRHLKAR